MFELWFDLKGFERAVETLVLGERQLRQNAKDWTKESGDLVRDEVRQGMPSFTGMARKHVTSRTSTVGTTYQATIGVDDASFLPQIKTMEGGRKPGAAPPPYSVLIPWIRAHNFGGNYSDEQAAFLLSRAIARRGSHKYPQGHQMFELGWNRAQPKVLATAMDIVKVF